MARRAALIKAARASATNLLVVDAGNALLNLDALPDDVPGTVTTDAFNRLNYDAVTLGSADLAALGTEGVARVRASASFALLSANVYLANTNELAAVPYVLRDTGNRRVAIVGLTDPCTAPGFRVRDPVRAARTWVRRARREADIVILLSHAGRETNLQIAERVRGIDVIVMGGNQLLSEPLRLGHDQTLLVHADRYAAEMAGRYVGLASLTFDGAGTLTDYAWQRVQLDDTVGEDKAMSNWLQQLGAGQTAP